MTLINIAIAFVTLYIIMIVVTDFRALNRLAREQQQKKMNSYQAVVDFRAVLDADDSVPADPRLADWCAKENELHSNRMINKILKTV